MIKHIKSFPGQYKGEKILFSSLESRFSLFFRQFWIIAAVFLISAFLLTICYFLNVLWLGIVLAALIIVAYAIEIGIQYFKTAFIITSRRVIKQERNGIFDITIKDLRHENIKQTVASKQNLLQMILGHGNITIHGNDNAVHLFFNGLPFHDEVARYISKIIDFINHNGPSDDLASFQPRKLRKKYGNPTHENIDKFLHHTKK